MTSTGPERVIGSRSKAGKSECHAVHLVPFWCPTGHSHDLRPFLERSSIVGAYLNP